MIETIGIITGAVAPFFNIPLILRIRKRRSSADISMAWTAGVMACALLMLPVGIASPDIAFKVFTVVNFVLFSAVAWHVVKYRRGPTAADIS